MEKIEDKKAVDDSKDYIDEEKKKKKLEDIN
jgi:hypothetical protein